MADEQVRGRARRRRLPWAVAASVVGAAAGVAVALGVRRVLGEDAPGAQDPEHLRAVVDVPPPARPLDERVPSPPVGPEVR